MRFTHTLLFIIFFACILAAIGSISVFYVHKDYMISANMPCDPVLQRCFVGDGIQNPTMYFKIQKKAYLVAPCDAWKGQCPPLSCDSSNSPDQCVEEYCDPAKAESCSF